jgi:hypothetical protein
MYRRPGRESDTFVPAQASELSGMQGMADRAAAVFQVAAELYESRRYRLEDGY